MREMKDSGIPWIGEIPKEWETTKIKYVAKLYNGDRGKNYPSGNDLLDEGIIFLTSNNIHGIELDCSHKISKYISKKRYRLLGGAKIKIDDIIYCLRGSIGNCSINVNQTIGTIASSLVDIRPGKIVPKFLNYCLQSDINYTQTKNYSTGSCAANLSAENVSNYSLTQPSIEEQQHIADYLDTKCSKIDSIRKNVEAEIEALKQYKKSVITEAVTKGLDKNVEMKDSGIPWIGKIPKDWKTDKFKYHLKRSEPRNPGNQVVLSLYRDYGIIPKDSRNDNHNVTSEDTSNYKYVQIGDFVVNKMKAWQGSVAVSNYEGIVSPAYYVYKFSDHQIYKKYLHYLLRACYKDEFMRLSGGLRVGQWDLSADGLGNTYILIPPYDEQVKIANYLDNKVAKIDSIIQKKQELLTNLDTYKKSLIYEYVTGKKEVPAV